MAYIRSKKIKRGRKRRSWFYKDDPEEYTYYQLVEGYRDENGKVKQRVVAHLGRNPTVEEALEDWAESQRRFAQHARNLRRGAEFIRAGVKPARYDGNRYKPVYYLPRENQDPNEEPPKQTFGQFLQGWHSDKGFFWHRGSLAELEAEAAAEEKKAAEYRERIVRLKEVVTKEVTPAANS